MGGKGEAGCYQEELICGEVCRNTSVKPSATTLLVPVVVNVVNVVDVVDAVDVVVVVAHVGSVSAVCH